MATICRMAIGSCIVLMFVCIRAMETVNSAGDVGGVYSIERKRGNPAGSEKAEFVNPATLQGNYDEYPLIVPKRAALLLDRLMVALHHALEEERNVNRRISEIYGRDRTPSFLLKGGSLADFDPTENDNMYSDEEEPDYDLRNLRDLKSPNRGSGETSFQRRTPHEEDTGSGRTNGRMYWRCYFNAVSCF
ncbi:uncharacterized protein LOC129920942 isoform X2 [Episyrphus balteatus]|uniref:uncharacterized protein LOC129920942 isoform X2 n=1 Tax=Episyrphus balteatus TaxID=286459 RepID=UPI0024851346|nr:uncharacterized protein LOC129920942 isoform X2 [Episyrphus balteatus]